MNHWLKHITIVVLCASPVMTLANDAVPPDAQEMISVVHEAAARRDFAALEGAMLEEFTWSFGGDASAKQAIESWRRDPGQLQQLERVTGLRCGRIDQEYVQCPSSDEASYRAGFTLTPQGWRMAYFLSGD